MSRRSTRFRWCSAAGPRAHPLPASTGTNTRNRRPPSRFLRKPLTKIRDTLYHCDLASLRSFAGSSGSPLMATSIAEHQAVRLAHAEAHAALHGLSLTPLRRQVYAAIVASDRPIGAYELLDALEPQRGRVPPTTIYRALGLSARARLRPSDRIEERVFCLLRGRRAASQPVSDVRRLRRDGRDSRRRSCPTVVA